MSDRTWKFETFAQIDANLKRLRRRQRNLKLMASGAIGVAKLPQESKMEPNENTPVPANAEQIEEPVELEAADTAIDSDDGELELDGEDANDPTGGGQTSIA